MVLRIPSLQLSLRLAVAFSIAALIAIAQSPAGGSGRGGRGPAANNDLGYTDTPLVPGQQWKVHDPARPHPAVVAPGAKPGDPPSDAIILFDGSDLSKWVAAKQAMPSATGAGGVTLTNDPAPWKVENGYFEVVPASNVDIATKEKFGDIQLHVEFASPAVIRGNSQNRGNSGIFIQGRYETQVLDGSDNPTYADGQIGAIYGQWPPLANPARKPGEWQTYDIVFEAPKFDGDKVLKPAYVTVFLNDVLMHNRKELLGPTVHRLAAKYYAQPAEDSILLQNHGGLVRYRNIWVRRIPGYDVPEKK